MQNPLTMLLLPHCGQSSCFLALCFLVSGVESAKTSFSSFCCSFSFFAIASRFDIRIPLPTQTTATIYFFLYDSPHHLIFGWNRICLAASGERLSQVGIAETGGRPLRGCRPSVTKAKARSY